MGIETIHKRTQRTQTAVRPLDDAREAIDPDRGKPVYLSARSPAIVLAHVGDSPYVAPGLEIAHSAFRASACFANHRASKHPALGSSAVSFHLDVLPTQPGARRKPSLRPWQPGARRDSGLGAGRAPLSTILQALPRCRRQRKRQPRTPSISGATAHISFKSACAVHHARPVRSRNAPSPRAAAAPRPPIAQ